MSYQLSPFLAGTVRTKTKTTEEKKRMANAGWRHKKRERYSPRIMKLARTAKKRRADIMTGPRILSVNGVRGVAWNGG